ncbi:ATP-dependent DNA helicase RecG [mine drainage metagenome]|uniref:ATP-dependent DNA helicase RecG n=1 Tax=mine drainage metagenome TaxID=410659 RepID=A0A1J5R2M4_9ZZZZ
MQARFAKLGLQTLDDLLLHLPLRYVDETRFTSIRDLRIGEQAQEEGEIGHAEIQYRPRKALICQLQDDAGGLLHLRFLHFYPSQVAMLKPGARIRAFGEVRPGFFGMEMVHPQCHVALGDTPLNEALTPIYPTTAGLSQAALRKWDRWALLHGDLAETLPPAVYAGLDLPSFADSLGFLHHPPADADLESLQQRSNNAWRRLAFDELLAQQLSMRRHHARRREQGAPQLGSKQQLTTALLRALPFVLTGAQQTVWAEISRDLAQPHPMQRLLQGDVGSGKTIVSALAALQAVENGWQAALMAPTEILAEQHYRKLSDWLTPLGVNIAWLSGAQSRSARVAALEAVKSGTAQIAIGTHALFQERVEFARLGLAIIDEQHRFGVHQRLALRQKGAQPHQLMMSATPIPRTLAMSYYADLDVSVIDELPPGRTPVATKLVSDARRPDVLARVREACRQGLQAYWVCPLIEESEALQLKTAVETCEQLTAVLPGLKVGLVHGRMKPAEKQAVMQAFIDNEIQLLVATTVIEVGVDVPNASLMVIEHAERMGLSQLHQLRGRVGRGSAQSACFLLYQSPLSDTARARLKIIYENSDGFEISRNDLRLRGPGEFLGIRQSGVPLLKIADLERDAALLEIARRRADPLLREQPQAVELHLQRWLGRAEDYVKV